MTIKDMLIKVVGADIKQSVAWIGSVGLCLGVVIAIYFRLGQYIAIENTRDKSEMAEIANLKAMIEPWNKAVDEKGTIIYPNNVLEKVIDLQNEIQHLRTELQKKTDDRFKRSDFEIERDKMLKANPTLVNPHE